MEMDSVDIVSVSVICLTGLGCYIGAILSI